MSKQRVRRGRAFWESAVREQAESGLTQEAYCRGRGLGSTTLQRWRTRLGYTSSSAAAGSGGRAVEAPGVDFVRVVVAASPAATPSVAPRGRQSSPASAPVSPPATVAELHLPFGAVLRCAPGTDAGWLADLVVACGRAAC